MGLRPGFAMVDTCAAEFAAETPYFYATYAAAGSPPEAPPVARPAALVIGSGPVRIGQGIEFDYCAVQAAASLREMGWQAVMVNSNPETVSTDFDASSRLYFEPLDAESVLEVVRAETGLGQPPLGALVQFGGQTPLNLAATLDAGGVPLLGLDVETIDQAEERVRFAALVDRLGILQPPGGMATSVEEAMAVADRIGYPVIVRPSFVIGGLAIDFAYGPEDLEAQLAAATVVAPDRPVRLDAYLEGLEVDVDAVCDGTQVLIPGLIEHVERAGVHSGDSLGFYPPQTLTAAQQASIVETMTRVSLALGVRGLVNAQFIVRDDGIYLLEVNPRASRTVPFLSKVTGVPMVDLATRVALGATLAELGWAGGLVEPPGFVAVKAPVFSTAKLRGVDPSLGPGMQSTGEVIGIHRDPRVAMAKALLAASLRPPVPGPDGALALVSIADRDKDRLAELATALVGVGYRLAATRGTASRLRALGHAVTEVARVAEEDGRLPTILDTIRTSDVRLVVNTPSPLPGPVRDAESIRAAALAEGILCLTSIDTAITAARSLEPDARAGIADVRPLGEWMPAGALPAGRVARPLGLGGPRLGRAARVRAAVETTAGADQPLAERDPDPCDGGAAGCRPARGGFGRQPAQPGLGLEARLVVGRQDSFSVDHRRTLLVGRGRGAMGQWSSAGRSVVDVHRCLPCVRGSANTRSNERPWSRSTAACRRRGSGEEAHQIVSGLGESVLAKAVVGLGAEVGDGHQAGHPERGQVVLHGRLADLQRLRELGQVHVAVAQQAQDAQARLVAERPVEADHGRRRRAGVGGIEGLVGHGIGEQAPVEPREEVVDRPREVARAEHDPADAGLAQPAHAAGRSLDQLDGRQGAIGLPQRDVARDDLLDARLDLLVACQPLGEQAADAVDGGAGCRQQGLRGGAVVFAGASGEGLDLVRGAIEDALQLGLGLGIADDLAEHLAHDGARIGDRQGGHELARRARLGQGHDHRADAAPVGGRALAEELVQVAPPIGRQGLARAEQPSPVVGQEVHLLDVLDLQRDQEVVGGARVEDDVEVLAGDAHAAHDGVPSRSSSLAPGRPAAGHHA